MPHQGMQRDGVAVPCSEEPVDKGMPQLVWREPPDAGALADTPDHAHQRLISRGPLRILPAPLKTSTGSRARASIGRVSTGTGRGLARVRRPYVHRRGRAVGVGVRSLPTGSRSPDDGTDADAIHARVLAVRIRSLLTAFALPALIRRLGPGGEDVSADVVDEGAMDAEEGGGDGGQAKAVKAIQIRATRQSPRILWLAILPA
jgi:hypothetical protein